MEWCEEKGQGKNQLIVPPLDQNSMDENEIEPL